MSTQVVAPVDGPAPGALPRERMRRRLRELDACLERLEGAHERGAAKLSGALALAIGRYVPGLVAGMPITHAIELVMREQEPHLTSIAALGPPTRPAAPLRTLPPPSVVSHADDGPPTTIDEHGARELTERIRAAAHTANRLCSLLVEAHERRAWTVLGYPTWSAYIRAEFRLSRSRSYELLEHGRVVRALEEATGVSGIPDISAYAASQIKRYLGEVVEAIRERVAGVPPERIAAVADAVVREARWRHATERVGGRAAAHPGIDLTRLYAAVDTIANLPDVETTLSLVPPEDARRLDGVHRASAWLTEFARVWPRAQETTGSFSTRS